MSAPMSGAAALRQIHALPEHVGDHVIDCLRHTPRGVYEAQRILAFHYGTEQANTIVAALVRAQLQAIERIL